MFAPADPRRIARPRGLLLDMDGTLTVPRLDYDEMKRDMGVPLDETILEAMATMPADRLARATRVLDVHEDRAARESELAHGCRDLFAYLDERAMSTAIITRNSAASLKTVWAKHALPDCVCVTRDDAAHKPDPAPIRLACDRLGLSPDQVWMVGDGRFDVEAGLAAGVKTVWISLGRDPRPFAAEPWRTVRDLPELSALLRGCDGGGVGA